MHALLRRKTNQLLLELWFVGALVIVAFARPIPWLLFACGALFGAVAGTLQLSAIRSTAATLLATTSMLETRSVIKSTRAGRAYLYVFWGSALLFLVLSWQMHGRRLLVGWLAAYCAFAFTRELVALRGVMELEAMSARAQETS